MTAATTAVHIRPARPADAAALSYLSHQAESEWGDLLAFADGSIVLVAERQGEVVGYSLSRARSCSGTAPEGEIVALYLDPPQHGRGIGRHLFAATADALWQRGCASLMLWVRTENRPARAFFVHLGGDEGDEQLSEADGTAMETSYYWSHLAPGQFAPPAG